MLITLTTDFGTADGYVAAMKGSILSVAPDVRLIDVTHEVPPQDVMAAAFTLRSAATTFPDGTVHLVVVDPGVGTDRAAVAARFTLEGRSHLFVGPDNGLLPLLLDGLDLPAPHVVRLDRPDWWRLPTPSATFHGRDIFGPVAAHLAQGVALDRVGSAMEALHSLHWPLPRTDAEGIDGMVLAVDHYGNCVTNISRSAYEAHVDARKAKCYIGSTILTGVAQTYSGAAIGEPVALFGSSDLLEIAVAGGHAADLLSISRGDSVNLVFEAAPRVSPPHAHAQPA